MPQTVVGKRFGIEQTEVSAIQRLQRAKTARLLEDQEKKNPIKRVKNVELSVPIAYGTISFWLGKKADDLHSHKWTVYIRSATNEDLGPIISKVVFQLHPSFNNPTRVVESAPFELSESGWGEFEISMTVFFQKDAAEKTLELFHHLKLYHEDDNAPQSTKKPVVVESYDELVFQEPTEAFYSRVKNLPAVHVNGSPGELNVSSGALEISNERKRGDTKDHQLGQWFGKYSETDELTSIMGARQQVQKEIAKLKSMLDSEAMKLKPSAP
ncbi:hypothetical protein SELMODRAFT_174113 [Selaginella moellendorffii]|uniref:YEATS domain-containing protein n=3 Tax=Selaginella moellendorffii TaxID=88036 RepID=D8RTG7_SELML|nr:transcription initiation factor TFIID subunit 14b isoform X2 [Selaginella moellendorffii]XP_002985664.2 transcription initiation factor TFIID subunit 14b isoform X2 [Selaginella moellendorffii]EFJ24512.1 hypothetical protein SELMODRAFT_174113 [Selaginella moellendorffii]|eukprot:XP_002974290.1 transcription initiation factor TFIID subunit 14b isoform X2 [Selaginella moellendorffii]